jgi:hypothetical protein
VFVLPCSPGVEWNFIVSSSEFLETKPSEYILLGGVSPSTPFGDDGWYPVLLEAPKALIISLVELLFEYSGSSVIGVEEM